MKRKIIFSEFIEFCKAQENYEKILSEFIHPGWKIPVNHNGEMVFSEVDGWVGFTYKTPLFDIKWLFLISIKLNGHSTRDLELIYEASKQEPFIFSKLKINGLYEVRPILIVDKKNPLIFSRKVKILEMDDFSGINIRITFEKA